MDGYSFFVRCVVCKVFYCFLCKVLLSYLIYSVCVVRVSIDFIIVIRSGGNMSLNMWFVLSIYSLKVFFLINY